jgi:membrane protease subunit (stomatin/prohibitin family)
VTSPLPENFEDLSTEKGFQFRFFCDTCSEGFTSRFVALRRAAPVEVGGRGGRKAGGGSVEDAVFVPAEADEGAYAAALKKAAAEMERHLRFCKDCGQWVCVKSCWNAEQKLCKDCAQEESEDGPPQWEETEEQTPAQREEKRERGPRLVECLNCGRMVEDRSFCSECGESLRGANVCPECDADVAAGAKFCPVCGAKL